jgi:uridine phosphorylase
VPTRLRPSASIAADAVLVGDPGRALMLAQELLDQPRMSNHARGLWGYSGQTADGDDLTVQSTGIGGPSAAVVLNDLAELGLKRAVRVGTCSAGDPELALGDVLVVEQAVAADPLHGLVQEGQAVRPEPALHAAIGGAGRAVAVRSGDVAAALFGDPPAAAAHDLQTAALLAVAARLGIAAAALLVVAETAAGEQIGDDQLEEAAKRAGRAAATALSA